MKKSKILAALAIVTVLVVPFSVFAATSDAPAAKSVRGFFHIDKSKLTDQQKADVADYQQKMADLQKDFINKMVANGTMTKEQGDAEIKRIEDALKNGEANGFLPGFGKGGPGDREKGGIFDQKGIDTSKLTDQQKADLMNTYSKMVTAQKDLVGKMVANGLLTSAQGDTITKKIDEMASEMQQNGLSKGMGLMMGGFEMFGMDRASTKLTDQQKADLADYSSKMADLRKELVNKLVSDNVITSAQGDEAIKRAEGAGTYQDGNDKGFQKGMMQKGMMQKGMMQKGIPAGKGRSDNNGKTWAPNGDSSKANRGNSNSNSSTAGSKAQGM